MLQVAVKAALIAVVALSAACGLIIAARHFGFGVSEGLMMGVTMGIAGTVGGYFAKSLQKRIKR